ncbi:MAG: acyl carrier protein [Bacteroidales bacterium]|nr:acyl carrier protein [Bacteroidales bacterium]
MSRESLNLAIAEEFEIEVSDITPDAPIKETLDLDSLSLLDLVAVVEGETGVKLSGTEAVKLLTFQALYDYLGL